MLEHKKNINFSSTDIVGEGGHRGVSSEHIEVSFPWTILFAFLSLAAYSIHFSELMWEYNMCNQLSGICQILVVI